MITVKGIVLKEKAVGENGKFIDVLTSENGVIELTVKGARKINSEFLSSTQLFAYSEFCYNESGKYRFLNSAEPIRIFYNLRNSLSKVSLACYFAEVLLYCAEPQPNNDILRLFLNTLHFLEKDLRNEKMLKSIFELRLMSEIGFMPDIVGCHSCGAFEPNEAFFSMKDGCFFCKECFSGNPYNFYKINISVLSSVRHIVLTDFDRLFNFRTSENTMNILSDFAEKYLLFCLERNFRTLDFYKSLK